MTAEQETTLSQVFELASHLRAGRNEKRQALRELVYAADRITNATDEGRDTRAATRELAIACVMLAHEDGNDLAELICEAMKACGR